MVKTAGSRGFLFKSVIILFYTVAIACACEAAATPTFTPTVTATYTNTPVVSSVWRVNAGGPLYPDSWGNTWIADTNFNSGTAHCVTNTVTNTNDSALYQCERFGNPFTYTFNVPAGVYQATLKFAELYYTATGARVFNVSINGTQVLNNYDIFLDTGGEYVAVSKVFNNISPISGQISMQFGPATVDNAQVCAIQINPMPPSPTPTVTACGTPAISPFIQVNSGAWQQVNTINVSQGSSVTLGPQPLTGGTWSWTGPSGFTSSQRQISSIPLSGGLNTFTVVYTDACGSQATMDFNVTVLTATPTATVLTETAGCAANITVDGIMNESAWASAALNPISKLCQGTNPNNVSGGFKTIWDTDSLYVGLVINDATLNAPQLACANYNDSSVEIFLDMVDDWGSLPYPGSTGDFHFMISYDCLQFCMNAAVALPPTGVQYASTHNAYGYTMEVRIPWQLLGVNPVIGANYQFDVQVDFNNGTNTRVGQLVWNGDMNDWKSSANFGDISLGYCPSPTATATPVPPSLTESFHIFPNPVNPQRSQAGFNYNIPNESEISIDIFTINGNHVKTVLDKVLKPAGNHTEDKWDAKNESGMDVLSGVYLCVMKVKDKVTGGTTRLVKKLAVLR
jgi:hypothetical protein